LQLAASRAASQALRLPLARSFSSAIENVARFGLSEEQLMFQDMARDFALAEMYPQAAQWDAEGIFPEEALRAAAAQGFGAVYCQEDVGGGSPTDAARPAATNQDGDNDDAVVEYDDLLQEQQHREAEDENRRPLERLFRAERRFRINRLAMRFPNYINHSQVQRWTSSSYDGSLARDPSFVENDPGRAASVSRSADSGGDYSPIGGGFGGGTSSGGGGGRF